MYNVNLWFFSLFCGIINEVKQKYKCRICIELIKYLNGGFYEFRKNTLQNLFRRK